MTPVANAREGTRTGIHKSVAGSIRGPRRWGSAGLASSWRRRFAFTFGDFVGSKADGGTGRETGASGSGTAAVRRARRRRLLVIDLSPAAVSVDRRHFWRLVPGFGRSGEPSISLADCRRGAGVGNGVVSPGAVFSALFVPCSNRWMPAYHRLLARRRSPVNPQPKQNALASIKRRFIMLVAPPCAWANSSSLSLHNDGADSSATRLPPPDQTQRVLRDNPPAAIHKTTCRDRRSHWSRPDWHTFCVRLQPGSEPA